MSPKLSSQCNDYDNMPNVPSLPENYKGSFATAKKYHPISN